MGEIREQNGDKWTRMKGERVEGDRRVRETRVGPRE